MHFSGLGRPIDFTAGRPLSVRRSHTDRVASRLTCYLTLRGKLSCWLPVKYMCIVGLVIGSGVSRRPTKNKDPASPVIDTIGVVEGCVSKNTDFTEICNRYTASASPCRHKHQLKKSTSPNHRSSISNTFNVVTITRSGRDRQGECGLDPESISGSRLRIRTPDHRQTNRQTPGVTY